MGGRSVVDLRVGVPVVAAAGRLMRESTGLALLATAHPVIAHSEPASLGSLVDRVVAARHGGSVRAVLTPAVHGLAPTTARPGRRLALVMPCPGVVTPPPATEAVRTTGRRPAASPVRLLAAHGGAGVSALLRAGAVDAGGCDAGRVWPTDGAVVLVARTSTSALECVQDAARRHAAGLVGGDVRLLGLVLIADAPGRLPARTSALADLVCGAFARVWQMPWLEEWRLAGATEPLPLHPEVARLIADLRALSGAGSAAEGEH